MNKLREAIKIQNTNKDTNEFVSAIITDMQGRVLILKRKDTLKLDPGKYDFCSGHIQSGETPTQAMFREMREEIQISESEILLYRKLGVIQTPHKLLPNTQSHIYHMSINLSLDEIDEKMSQITEPEMESAQFLNNIDETRKLLRDTDLFRTEFTEEIDDMLKKVEEKEKVIVAER